jgi:WD40 repeat protein
MCRKAIKRFLTILTLTLCLIRVNANGQPAAREGRRPDPRSELVIVAVSPDGTQLAIARSNYDIVARNGRVELWDLKSGVLRQTITGFDGSVSATCFTPDGQYLVTTSTEFRQSKIQTGPRDRRGDVVTEMKWWEVSSGNFIRKIALDQAGGLETVLCLTVRR